MEGEEQEEQPEHFNELIAATGTERVILEGDDTFAADAVKCGILLRLAFRFRSVRFVIHEHIRANANNSVHTVFAFTVAPNQEKTIEFAPNGYISRRYTAELRDWEIHVVMCHKGEQWRFIRPANHNSTAIVNVVTLADGDEHNYEIPIYFPLILFLKRGFTYNIILIDDIDIFAQQNVHELFAVHEQQQRVLHRNDQIQEEPKEIGVHYALLSDEIREQRGNLDQECILLDLTLN